MIPKQITLAATGLSGMIGKNLTEFHDGDLRVKAGVRLVALTRQESDCTFLEKYGIEIRRVDYDDPESFAQALGDVDVVLHMAGATKAKSQEAFDRYNTCITKTLLSAVEKFGKKIRQFIYISSLSAGGPSKNPLSPRSEKMPDAPVTWYGKSKLKAEALVKEGRVPWTIVRFPPVFGKYDHDGLTLLKMAKGGCLLTVGREDDYFSYICARDAAEMLFRIVANEETYRNTFYVSYDKPVPAVEFCRTVRGMIGSRGRVRYIKLPMFAANAVASWFSFASLFTGRPSIINREKIREIKAKNWICTNDKMKKALKIISLGESGALQELIMWYRDKGLL